MAEDILTLTIRIHDPKEKHDHTKAAVWVLAKIAREDTQGTLTKEQFAERYFKPVLDQLSLVKFSAE